jgi:hypothetical protein
MAIRKELQLELKQKGREGGIIDRYLLLLPFYRRFGEYDKNISTEDAMLARIQKQKTRSHNFSLHVKYILKTG